MMMVRSFLWFFLWLVSHNIWKLLKLSTVPVQYRLPVITFATHAANRWLYYADYRQTYYANENSTSNPDVR